MNSKLYVGRDVDWFGTVIYGRQDHCLVGIPRYHKTRLKGEKDLTAYTWYRLDCSTDINVNTTLREREKLTPGDTILAPLK